MKKYIILLLLSIFVFLVGGCDKNPNGPVFYSATISGTVAFESSSSDSVSATVKVYQTTSAIPIATTNTDANGHFSVRNVPTEPLRVVVTALGFKSYTYENVTPSAQGVEVLPSVTLIAATPMPNLSVVMDGVIDVSWQPAYQNVQDPSTMPNNWGPSNDCGNLYMARDSRFVYIAVDGNFSASDNTVNIYIDRDYGSATGVANFWEITTADDNRLKKNVKAPAEFGAEFGFSTWALNQDQAKVYRFSALDGLAAGVVDSVQIRIVSNTGSKDVIEIAIPIHQFATNGVLSTDNQMGVIVLIGGGGDQYICIDQIPQMQNLTGNQYTTSSPLQMLSAVTFYY